MNHILINGEEILQNNIRGINAMSISEITGIPRPTVIRKINSLIKLNMVEMDKNKLLNIKFNNKSYKETSELQMKRLMIWVFHY